MKEATRISICYVNDPGFVNDSCFKIPPFSEKIVVLHQPVLFVIHLLKTRNIISCFAALRESCLSPLHNYLEIDGIVPPIKKKLLGSKMVFFTLIFKLMLGFFSLSNRLFPCPTVSVNFHFYVYVLFDRHV